MFKNALLALLFFVLLSGNATFAQDIPWLDSYRVSLHQNKQDNIYNGPSIGGKPGTFYGVYSMGDYFAGFGLGHKWDLGIYGKANFGMSYSLDSEMEDKDKFGINYGAGFGLGATFEKELDQQAALKVYYFADIDRIGITGLAFQPAVRFGSFLVEATLVQAMGKSKDENNVTMQEIGVTYLGKHSGFGIKLDMRTADEIGGSKVTVNQIHLVYMIY